MSDTWRFVDPTITERFRRTAAGAGDDHGDHGDGGDHGGDDGRVDGDGEDSFQVFEIHFTKPSSSSCGQWVKVFCHHDSHVHHDDHHHNHHDNHHDHHHHQVL